jgi:hypothetical protein
MGVRRSRRSEYVVHWDRGRRRASPGVGSFPRCRAITVGGAKYGPFPAIWAHIYSWVWGYLHGAFWARFFRGEILSEAKDLIRSGAAARRPEDSR